MLAYCLNNPVRYADLSGNYCIEATQPEDDDDEKYKLVGAGIQVDLSGTLGVISTGFGIEVIIYWDTPECHQTGKPIVAVYIYNEGNLSVDTKAIKEKAMEIVELLLDSIDVIKTDGISAIEAVLAGSKSPINVSASLSVSAVGVWGNSEFYGVDSYLNEFEYVSATVGSVKGGYAWSDCCRTGAIGYNYNIGGPLLYLALPTISRGKSYYRLLWDSRM